MLQQHWLTRHRADTWQPASQQSSHWNHTWGSFKQNTPWNFSKFEFANLSKPIYYPKIIYFPVAPAEPTKEPWSPASIAELVGSLDREGRLPRKLLETAGSPGAAAHLEEPYPILQGIRAVGFPSESEHNKKGKKYWKAYTCTKYSGFCRHLVSISQNNSIFLTTINELFYEFWILVYWVKERHLYPK